MEKTPGLEAQDILRDGVLLLEELVARGLPVPDLQGALVALEPPRPPEKPKDETPAGRVQKGGGDLKLKAPAAPRVAVNREALAALDEAGLCAAAQTCGACKLADTRTKVAFANGQPLRGVMFVGEGPGQTEDETGQPFVGRAGKLLDQMIAALGWKRPEVLVTNIVKCRPPGNRDPEADEVAACRPWLDAQLKLAAPKLLVAIGRPAAQSLLATTQSLSGLRGKVHSLGGIPLVVTYHPAYLLRSPANKAEAWKDLRFLRQTLDQLQAGQAVAVNGLRVGG